MWQYEKYKTTLYYILTFWKTYMQYLDTTFSISFISESGKEATFYPIGASEFIEYLEENEPGITNHILNNENIQNQEIANFLQEAVFVYLEENISHYENAEQLAEFIIESAITDIYISANLNNEIQIDDVIGESIINFFETDGYQVQILENINQLIQEITAKRMVRGGRIIKRLDCPPGSKLVSGRCVRMGSSEVRTRMKAALKATRTRRKHMSNTSFANAVMKKRKKSMKLGNSRGVY